MPSEHSNLISRWGKAGQHGECHPLIWHSLDVAAVACELLDKHAGLRHLLTTKLGLTNDSLRDWIFVFAAIHDIGKFSYRFQFLRGDIATVRLAGELPGNPQKSNLRHDQLGLFLWEKRIKSLVMSEYCHCSDEWTLSKQEQYLSPWAMSAFGHHGQPLKERISEIEDDQISQKDIAAAKEFVKALRPLMIEPLLVQSTLEPKAAIAAVRQTSWLISGLITLADWLGSNTTFFHYFDKEVTFESYWTRAANLAVKATTVSGVLPAAVGCSQGIVSIFPRFADYQLSPLQKLAENMPIDNSPRLIICEDVTGAGKTEAAMILALRLMQNTSASGLFLALPTMATANGMFGRTYTVYRNLFENSEDPSLVLSHSSRDLDKRFKNLVQQLDSAGSISDDLETGIDTSVASCTAWLSDSNKKALLAQVGVGTIDQVLQSVLLSKHQSLRMLGLFGKVLVVDEVHANDAYMHRLLCVLLSAHSSLGGSAILLSATLPQKMRNELFKAYDADSGDIEASKYPLLTHASVGGRLNSIHVGTPDRVARRVEVDYRTELSQVLEKIVGACRTGRCVVWVRNSVADARDAKKLLSDLMPSMTIDFFHARFAIGDRLNIENHVVRSFGPESTHDDRFGRILIATQVVEQSLDIDFDLMISDLAPIDLLIQRAGRLCRHVRDKNGDRQASDKDARGTPLLIVYGPAPADVSSKDWVRNVLPATAYVYPDHVGLWLTAKLLVDRGGWIMPDDARTLIETVYGEEDCAIPECLEYSRLESIGEAQSNSSIAKANTIKMAAGYKLVDNRSWWTEINTPTRLGEKSQLVYLAKREGEQIVPWRDADGDDAWAMSRMQIPAKHISEGSVGADIDRLKSRLPGRGKWCKVLVFEPKDSGWWEAEVIDCAEGVEKYRYSSLLGLVYKHEKTV